MDRPLVRQTIEDCLTEATDIAGLIDVLKGLRDGSIERVAIDTPEPSALPAASFPPNSIPFSMTHRWRSDARKRLLARRSLDVRSLDGRGSTRSGGD